MNDWGAFLAALGIVFLVFLGILAWSLPVFPARPMYGTLNVHGDTFPTKIQLMGDTSSPSIRIGLGSAGDTTIIDTQWLRIKSIRAGDGSGTFTAESGDVSGDSASYDTGTFSDWFEGGGVELANGGVQADSYDRIRVAHTIEELQLIMNELPETIPNDERAQTLIRLEAKTYEPDCSVFPVRLKRGVHIQGAGMKATKINVENCSGEMLQLDNQGEQSASDRVRLSQFMMDGAQPRSNLPGSDIGQIGIFFENVHTYEIERVLVRNVDTGVLLQSSWIGNIRDSEFSRNNFIGLCLVDGPDGRTNALRIKGGKFNNNGKYGIFAEKMGGLDLAGINVEQNQQYGVLLSDADGVSVNGAFFESNGNGLDRDNDGDTDRVDIGISPPSESLSQSVGISIQGNSFSNQNAQEVVVGDATGVHISGNRFNFTSCNGECAGVELADEARDVTVESSNNWEDHDIRIAPPIDGGNLRGEVLNDGVWSTELFGSLFNLSSLAANIQLSGNRSITVEIASDQINSGGPVINGASFPPGTQFVGVGKPTLTVSGSASNVVELERSHQSLENVIVDSTGSSDGNANAINIASGGDSVTISDVLIQGSNRRGVDAFVGNSLVLNNVICNEANVSSSCIELFSTGGAEQAGLLQSKAFAPGFETNDLDDDGDVWVIEESSVTGNLVARHTATGDTTELATQ